MEGFAQTAILLTVIQTCRVQGRSAFEFFKQALMATGSLNHRQCLLIPDTST